MEPILIDAMLRTARAVAIVAGVMVVFDYVTNQDIPPHRPKHNALAWAVIALACAVPGGVLFYQTFGHREPTEDIIFVRLVLWAGLATGLTMRAAIRAHHPRLVWGSAVFISVAGFVLQVLDAVI